MLNDFMKAVYAALKGEKANFLLIRGLGSRVPTVRKFPMKACALTGLEINKGIARLVGMNIIDTPEDVPNELSLKKKPVERALKNYDFVFVHFKNIDEPGHDGDVREKVRQIELTDSLIGKLDLGGKLIVATSDHCTVCKKKSHTTDPIPTLISFGPSKEKRKFGERYCTDFSMPSYKLIDYIKILNK
jgi:2,3-bisphosphoglycerate-independent phosphoglycerate mutase